jgi:hypothetical protein
MARYTGWVPGVFGSTVSWLAKQSRAETLLTFPKLWEVATALNLATPPCLGDRPEEHSLSMSHGLSALLQADTGLLISDQA